MNTRVLLLGRAVLRALLLWAVGAVLTVIALTVVLLLGAIIAQPSGMFFNPAYAFTPLLLAVLPGYLLFALLRTSLTRLPSSLNHGWLPSVLGVLGIALIVYLLLSMAPSSTFYIRSVVDMSQAALYALQGLVASLVVLGEGMAGLWSQKTAQPATAGSPESVK